MHLPDVRKSAGLALALSLACGQVACRNTSRTSSVTTTNWAAHIEEDGLPNLHKVSDDFYRGAQPTREGLVRLEHMGVQTLINVRTGDSDRKMLQGVDLHYEYWPISPWRPRDEHVIRFLKIVTDPQRTPVFLHCEHGADRTGMLTAMYRVCVQGWPKQDAIDEMTRGGMGFHSFMGILIGYVRNVDVERIQREAGIR